MSRKFKFTSDVSISLFEGGETEFTLIVEYTFTPPQSATYDEPGHGGSADIHDIALVSSSLQPLVTPGWFDAMVRADESFENTLIFVALDTLEAEKEDAAERRHEERMEAFR